MAKAKKMANVAKKGSRLEQLKNLAQILAEKIDQCASDQDKTGMRLLPLLSKQYRDTIREIEEIEGVDQDDEVGEILSARQADGKPGAVR